MDIASLIPELIPSTVSIAWLPILQSVIWWLLGTMVFVVIILIYRYLKNNNPYNGFVQGFDWGFELVYEMFNEVGGWKLGRQALTFTTVLFFFILWQNIFWLLGDMIVLVWPAGHHVFRPMTTDIISNWTVAVISVVLALVYGFVVNGFGFIQKYIPINGMWIVTKITHWYDYITKFLDILLGLLLGIIELLGEVGRMLSLSLRLFGNMFVGMILLTLLIAVIQYAIHVPFAAPLFVFAYEFAVSFIQAFIFALLTTIYFRLGADGTGH